MSSNPVNDWVYIIYSLLMCICVSGTVIKLLKKTYSSIDSFVNCEWSTPNAACIQLILNRPSITLRPELHPI